MSRRRLPRGGSAVIEGRRRTRASDLDFFPTPPWAARAGAELIGLADPAGLVTCWEPACGEGHMAHGLSDYCAFMRISDVYPYGFGQVLDFLNLESGDKSAVDWIVTNPPFAHAEAFLRQAWPLASRGVALLCRLAFRETIGRHELLSREIPLSVYATFAERVPMLKGRYEIGASSRTAYAWFVFLKPAAIETSPLREAILSAREAGGYLGLAIGPGTKARLFRDSDRAFAREPQSKPKRKGAK